jgi:ATP-dependent DNA ligase
MFGRVNKRAANGAGISDSLQEESALKTLAALMEECDALGIQAENEGCPSKEPYLAALREFHWRQVHPDEPLPAQIMPMLLADWNELERDEAQAIEQDQHCWAVQPKLGGVRALLHVGRGGIRVTTRNICETTYRLSEYQHHLAHLAESLQPMAGTILDGELVCPLGAIDTDNTKTQSALQATTAILATRPANARKIQAEQKAWLRFHAFDLLQYHHADVTYLPLSERLPLLSRAFRLIPNPHLEEVRTCIIGKLSVHQQIVGAGGEGTVWKKLDRPYETGRRVTHWVKRKRDLGIAAFEVGSVWR